MILKYIEYIKYGIIVVILIIINIYISLLKNNITTLTNELDNCKVSTALAKANNNVCYSSLTTCNDAVAKLQNNYDANLGELDTWRNKKPEIKYVTIEKIREVKSDDCKDIKTVIDATRSIKFDSL